MLQIGNYINNLFIQYDFQTYNEAKHEFQVKKLNIFQCIARRLLGWYAETQFQKVTKAFVQDWEVKGVSDFLATTKNCSIPFTAKLVNLVKDVDRLFKLIESKKERPLVVPEVEEAEVGEVNPHVILSGTDPLVHPTPNAGVYARGKMFGVSYIDGSLYEVDPDQVNIYPLNRGQIEERARQGIKDTNVVKYSYRKNKKSLKHISSKQGAKTPLPSRKVDFTSPKRCSYHIAQPVDKGFPIYPYWNRKDMDQRDPVIKLSQPGANHVTDSEVFKINSATGHLQLAVFYRPHERVWALSRSLVKDDIYTAITPFSMDYGDDEVKDLKERRWALLRYETDWTKIFKGIIPDDPRNTKHSWMETKVQAFLIPKEQEEDWKQVNVGEPAKWLTLTPELIEGWPKGKDQLHKENTSFVMQALLHPKFQYQLMEAAKASEHKDAAKHLAKLIIAAERHAEKLELAKID